MKSPCQKVVKCYVCGYEVLSRDTFLKRNLNERPYYCGMCGSKDFFGVKARGYHLVICRKSKDIKRAVEILGGKTNLINNVRGIPHVFLSAFKGDSSATD